MKINKTIFLVVIFLTSLLYSDNTRYIDIKNHYVDFITVNHVYNINWDHRIYTQVLLWNWQKVNGKFDKKFITLYTLPHNHKFRIPNYDYNKKKYTAIIWFYGDMINITANYLHEIYTNYDITNDIKGMTCSPRGFFK